MMGNFETKPKTTKAKTIYRLAPCPSYDIEALESWLNDMARDGLFLKQHGVHFGVFCFVKGAPAQQIYRLEATKNPSTFSDDDNMPTEDVVALYQELGWDYVARHQNFDIYRANDADTRELNTDPTLQALTISMVKKRQLWAMIPFALNVILLWVLGRNEILLSILTLGSPLVLCGIITILCSLYGSFAEITHLSKLRKQLQAQGTLSHRKNWKANKSRHFLQLSLQWGMMILLIAIFAHACQTDASGARLRPLTAYDQEPPFATLTDFVPNDVAYIYTPQTPFDEANTVEQWQDPLAPENIKWIECATLTQNDEIVLDAYYTVDYHQLASPWLAARLAREYSHAIATGFSREETPTLERTPAADYFAIYDVYLGVTFVIQQGNTVAKVTFYDYESDNPHRTQDTLFTIEKCAEMVTESLDP